MHHHDTHWVYRQGGYRSNNSPTWDENRDTHMHTQPLWCHKCSLFLFLFPLTISVFLFLNQCSLLSLLNLRQAAVHRVVWSPHLSIWRVMEVPVSPRVLSQPDLSLSPTLKMRTPLSKWQNTSPLGLVRPCVPTATWSSGEGKVLQLIRFFSKAQLNYQRILETDHCTSTILGSSLYCGDTVITHELMIHS